MKQLFILLAAVALFASGCDTMQIRRYQIIGVTPASADAAKLKTVLQNVAGQSGLKTGQPASSNCLAYYTNGPVALEATFSQDTLLIQLVGGYGTPSEYKHARQLLAPALTAEFDGRVTISR